MSSKEKIARGEHAARLLADPVLQKAFDDCRSNLLNNFETAPLNDKDGIFDLRLQLKALQSVKALLSRYVDDGTLEKAKERENVG